MLESKCSIHVAYEVDPAYKIKGHYEDAIYKGVELQEVELEQISNDGLNWK